MVRVALLVPAVVLAGCIDFQSGGAYACGSFRDCAEHETCWQDACVAVAPLQGDRKLAGKTRADWAVAWVRWLEAQASTNHPIYDLTGEYCDTGQPEDAFFLSGDDVVYGTSTTNRTCTIPAGRPLVFPLFWWENDNNGRAVNDRQADIELKQSVIAAATSVTALELDFDGTTYALGSLEKLRIGPTQVTYDLNAGDPLLEPLDDQSYEVPGWLDGFFVVLPPPRPGTYALHWAASYAGADGGPASVDSNYYLEVR